MRRLILIIAFLPLKLPFNSFAGSTESYLLVTCKVVRPGQVMVNIPKQSFHTFSYVTEQKTMISDIEINCPQGTAVNITFEANFDNDKKIKVDPLPHIVDFYKDANCTEVWQPFEAVGYFNANKGLTVSDKIYCKTNNKIITPGIDKKVVLIMLKIDY